MGALLALIPWAWRLGAVAVIVAGMGTVALVAHHQWYGDGYKAGDAYRSAVDEKARLAMIAANEKALREAEALLFKTADKLSVKSLELDDALAQILLDADTDPVTRPPGFGVDRVRRLNSIAARGT